MMVYIMNCHLTAFSLDGRLGYCLPYAQGTRAASPYSPGLASEENEQIEILCFFERNTVRITFLLSRITPPSRHEDPCLKLKGLFTR